MRDIDTEKETLNIQRKKKKKNSLGKMNKNWETKNELFTF